MNFRDFRHSLAGGTPPAGLSGEVTALWFAASGDWDRAHEIVQDLSSSSADWIHAHLHRAEGDLANARYWYRRAGRTETDMAIAEEWEAIARELVGAGSDV